MSSFKQFVPIGDRQDLNVMPGKKTGITLVAIIQVLVVLALIVGIILMNTYDYEDRAYKTGKGMVIASSIIIGLNVLLLIIGGAVAGYAIYKIDKM